MVLLLVVSGCGEREREPAPVSAGLRIASLSPAMTTMVIDLGLEDALVGRTPFCRGLARSIPVVGSLEEIDPEIILQVQPTLLLVQVSAAGLDPGLESLAERRGFRIVQHHLDRIEDIEAAVIDIADASGRADAVARAESWRAELREMEERASSAATGRRVLLLYGVDPFGAAGTGTYLDEILRTAGGQNALARSGWREMAVEEVLATAPDMILLFGGDPGVIGELPWDVPPLIRQVNQPDALEPSTRAIQVATEVRRLLEGDA